MKISEILEGNKSKEHRHMPDWKVDERLLQGITDGTYVPDMFTDDGTFDEEDNQIVDNSGQVEN